MHPNSITAIDHTTYW